MGDKGECTEGFCKMLRECQTGCSACELVEWRKLQKRGAIGDGF